MTQELTTVDDESLEKLVDSRFNEFLSELVESISELEQEAAELQSRLSEKVSEQMALKQHLDRFLRSLEDIGDDRALVRIAKTDRGWVSEWVYLDKVVSESETMV